MTDDELIEIVQDCEDIIDEGRDEDEISPIELRNILDLVETIAGHKPLHLLRGLIHPEWHDFILAHAAHWDLYDTVTQSWETADPTAAWDPVMREHLGPYVVLDLPCFSATQAVITTVEHLGQYVPAPQEAALLGYPVCCVHAYHERHHSFGRHIADAYRVASAGNPDRLRELIEQDIAVPIDQQAAEAFKNGFLSPFCSFAYCDACAGDESAPGPQANRARQMRLQTIAPGLLARLDRAEALYVEEGQTWALTAKDSLADGIVWSRDIKNLFPAPAD